MRRSLLLLPPPSSSLLSTVVAAVVCDLKQVERRKTSSSCIIMELKLLRKGKRVCFPSNSVFFFVFSFLSGHTFIRSLISLFLRSEEEKAISVPVGVAKIGSISKNNFLARQQKNFRGFCQKSAGKLRFSRSEALSFRTKKGCNDRRRLLRICQGCSCVQNADDCGREKKRETTISQSSFPPRRERERKRKKNLRSCIIIIIW